MAYYKCGGGVDVSKDTVAADKMLSGFTAHASNGAPVTGTIPTKTVSTTTLNPNASVTVAAGYYATDTTISNAITASNYLAATTYSPSTTDRTISAGKYLTGDQVISKVTGTAVTSQVLKDYTFSSSNGIGIKGTMPTKAAETFAASTADRTISSGQYLSGTQTIKAATLSGTASNILSGQKVILKSNNNDITSITGTMENKGSANHKASAVTSDSTYTYLSIPANGYYNTDSKIYTENSNTGGSKIYYLGKNTSFDIKTLLPEIDYTALTVNNFIFSPASATASHGCGAVGFDSGWSRGFGITATITLSYDNSTGVLTLNGTSNSAKWEEHPYVISTISSVFNNISVYLVIGEIQTV